MNPKLLPKSASQADPTPRKFETLDALRGIAALAVVAGHIKSNLDNRYYPQHAYLAVDFFFALSGFVLTYAYQRKLDSGLSTTSFLKARAIRLYPLYLVGIFAYFCWFLFMALHKHEPPASLPMGTFFFFLAIFFLPVPPNFTAMSNFAFPFDPPTWSLFFEILANIFHATLGRRRSLRALLGFLLAAAAALLAFILREGGIDYGTHRNETLFGLLRVLVSYAMGMVLFRVWSANRGRFRIPSLLPTFLLIAILLVPAEFSAHGWFEAVAVFLLLPVTLLLAAFSDPGLRLRPLFTLLGTTSYAIYVLHLSLWPLFSMIWKAATHRSLDQGSPWSGFTFLAFILVFSLVADRFYDIPIRARLRQYFKV